MKDLKDCLRVNESRVINEGTSNLGIYTNSDTDNPQYEVDCMIAYFDLADNDETTMIAMEDDDEDVEYWLDFFGYEEDEIADVKKKVKRLRVGESVKINDAIYLRVSK